MLEHEAHLPVARGAVGDVLSVVQDGAGVGDLQTGEDAQEGRLAGAGGTEQGEQRAALDLEVDAVDGDEAAKALRDVLEDDAHAARSSRPLTISVTIASRVSSEATAKDPDKLYS